MPASTTHLKQIVSYTDPAVHASLDAERLKIQRRLGQRMTMSAHVSRILQRHVNRNATRSK